LEGPLSPKYFNKKSSKHLYVVGGFNPFEKYQSNFIISPHRGKNGKCFKPQPNIFLFGGLFKTSTGTRLETLTYLFSAGVWSRKLHHFLCINKKAAENKTASVTQKSSGTCHNHEGGWKMEDDFPLQRKLMASFRSF